MHDLGRLHPHHRDDRHAAPVGGRARTTALAVLCVCALTTAIDMTVTNVALPSIATDLDAGTNGLQWTVDAYNLGLAGLLVLGGALADRYGRRRVFLLGYCVFALASTLAAFSPTIEALVGARALMSVGAAGVTAPALAIIASMYPPEERAGAIGLFVVFGASGLAVGPILGGLLLDHFWWGSVFLVNVPIVVLGVVVGARTIAESRAPEPEGGRPPLDVVGAALSVVGLGALVFGIIEGPGRGWTSAPVLGALAVGATGIGLFTRRELQARAPLFDVRILGRPAVISGSVTLLVAYVLFNGFLFLDPQFLQGVRGESIVVVGLLFVPFAVVFGLCSRSAPRLVARFGARTTIPAGLVVGAAACGLFAAGTGPALWPSVLASVVLGAGLSLLIAPPSTVVMNALPDSAAGDGSSLNFVSRFVGASIGIAVIGSVLASVYTSEVDPALAGLDPTSSASAQGSLQGALEVAGTLPPPAGAALTGAARDAFAAGATAAYAVVGGLALLAAVVAWWALGRADTGPGGPGASEAAPG